MADVVPGTQVRMRIERRYSHYNIGDLIAVDFWAARELEAKRLATPLDLLVPMPAQAAAAVEAVPVRQPGATVRK